MLHQDGLSRRHPVLVPPGVPCPAMRDAMQCQKIAILCLDNVNLHWEAILGDETWLRKRRRAPFEAPTGLVIMTQIS